MHISFHMGAHCTDDDRLVKSLLKNKGALGQQGVAIPGPSKYRKVLAEVVAKLGGGVATRETQDVMLEAILDDEEADRIVFSWVNFLGSGKRALEHNQLYHLGPEKARLLRNLFPDDEVEFFIGMRNPATFVPALFEAEGDGDLAAFLNGTDPRNLFWSDMVGAIRDALPDCSVTVWCNEDTPLIWPELMREITGLQPGTRINGGLDVLREIIAHEGLKRLRHYMDTHPPQNEMQRRRILSAFLDKYALEDEIEVELDLPGWSHALVDQLSRAYDEDVLEIARIPGVNVLTV